MFERQSEFRRVGVLGYPRVFQCYPGFEGAELALGARRCLRQLKF